MKEFVENLIGRLEEETYDMEICEEQFDMNKPYFKDVPYKMIKLEDAIEIANQLAEEYNNGWIPCSEKLPEEGKAVLTCDKDGWISVRINMKYNGKKNDFECGYYEAWMPLPEPYKKGE